MRKFIAGALIAALLGTVVVAFTDTIPLKFSEPPPGGGGYSGSGSESDSVSGAGSDTSRVWRVFGATSITVHVSADTNTVTDSDTLYIGISADSLSMFTVQYSWDGDNWTGDLGTGAADSTCNCQMIGHVANKKINNEAGGANAYIYPLTTELPIVVPYMRSISTVVDRPAGVDQTTKAALQNFGVGAHIIFP